MRPTHHDIDITPIPEDKRPVYINEPWLVDQYMMDYGPRSKEPDSEDDNIRVYVPMDLNAKSILHNLEYVINKYGEANEKNEISFSQEVDKLICQIEIYDQLWFTRNIPSEGSHSAEAKELVRKFVELLEDIPDGCAEIFPFELIDYLREEYLTN